MKELMQHIRMEAAQGRDCYLVALIESEGSTPRSSGAYMLVNSGGLVCGTIGGGGMEYAAMQLAQRRLVQSVGKSFQQGFDLSPAAGMACGGYCALQFCYLPAGARTMALAEQILAKMAANEPWWLLLPLGAGSIRLEDVLPHSAAVLSGADAHRCQLRLDGQLYYAEQYCYDGVVYVFGAGHVARELVPLLCHLGFRCVVFDDRAEFADAQVFATAERVQQVDYNKLAQVCSLGANDYAVVMTRGHVHDANCERFLLGTEAGYIGIMGSKNKARLAREALLAEGYSEQQLARIITPIGIDIGSETPAEIAVAIAAQLISVRSQRD